jgi:beta-lactamase class A
MAVLPDWTNVSRSIEGAEQCGATLGVSVIAPGGARFSHDGTRRCVAASTVKIPIMTELFRQVDAGGQSLDALHALLEGEKASGSGVLGNLHTGYP